MLKLELDWAGDDTPETGVVCDDEVLVVVEFDERPGPAGHPLVRVYASREAWLPEYREAMALDAWLLDAYGEDDAESREYLLDTAVTV